MEEAAVKITGRRVVTGFTKEGKSCVKWDAEIQPINLRPGFDNIPMWATKKLPAVNVFVDYTGTGLTAFKFPSERAYVSFSGPPGGPLGLVVEAPGKSVANGIDLSVIAKERCGATAMISKPQSIVFSGANRPAISCVYGEAVARAEHLLIGITVGKEGVLIDAYQSAGKNGPSPPVELKKKLAFLSKLDIIP